MKMLSVFLLIISTSACMAQPSNVNSSAGKIDCAAVSNSLALDDCVKKKMSVSNSLLLTEMTSFEKRAKKAYAPAPALGKELIDKVRVAQEAWRNYRDKNCIVEAYEIEEGTPAYITTVNNCIILLSEERVRALQKLLQ